MAIELIVEPYCADCLEFEPDVEKPHRTLLYLDDTGEGIMAQSDTTVKCIHKKRCANMMNFLKGKKEA